MLFPGIMVKFYHMVESITITTNKKAFHDYHILETFEAGLVLKGTEIKSIRERMVNIHDAYARLENGELWLLNSHVPIYKAGSYLNHDPERRRKLLLHRRQVEYLAGLTD
jgi:SsrA-binding protein